MGLFDSLFRKKQQSEEKPQSEETPQPAAKADATNIADPARLSLEEKAAQKERSEPIPKEELLRTFATFFAPNTEFYSVPGSEKFQAYFQVVNDARDEMFAHPKLFYSATRWTPQMLAELVNNPKPGITNMMICGLIFSMGEYAVIPDRLVCVDFCETIPNCIALYLLLNMQKPSMKGKRMLLDVGDGADSSALVKAIETLKTCDPDWDCRIWSSPAQR